jgi:hypothetical protein
MRDSPFRGVHVLHAFEGFEIEGDTIVARCDCGEILGTSPAAFRPCPECSDDPSCARCGGTRSIVDHARLAWSLPE